MRPPAPLFGSVIERILREEITSVNGLWGSSKALFLSLLQATFRQTILLVTPTPEEAEERFEDLRFFVRWQAGEFPVRLFPSSETLPYDPFPPHAGLIHSRMESLAALMNGDPCILVTSAPAVVQRVLPRKQFRDTILTIQVGDEFTPERLTRHLVAVGYETVSMVTRRGEFSLRGGILDLYSPVSSYPLRIEFFGDWVESLRWFDPESQRTLSAADGGHREETRIFPAREGLGPEKFPQQEETTETLFDYAGGDRPENVIVVYDEIPEVRRKAHDYIQEVRESYEDPLDSADRMPPVEALYLSEEDVLKGPSGSRVVTLSGLPLEGESPPIPIQSVHSIGGWVHPAGGPRGTGEALPLKTAAQQLDRLRKDHLVVLVCSTEGQRDRIHGLLEEYETASGPASPAGVFPLLFEPGIKPVLLLTGKVSSGFVDSENRLALFNEEDIFGKKFRGRAAAPSKGRVSRTGEHPFRTSFEELHAGDLLVHVHYGIGRYEGLRHLSMDKVSGDYLLIRYAGEDSLYLPVDKLQMVQKYAGVEGQVPPLDRLGGNRWEKTRAKVQKAIEEIARDLLDLYASREAAEGYAFSRDNVLLRELEATFEFEETPDQLDAIEAVKCDMERPRPMDRLVCGDVGYGKTEVALRAAAKAVLDGKQAALLVPTTLLAQQHYQTFSYRFAAFPVRVEMLSRFRSPGEQKRILKDLSEGRIDILIGTHKLLQKDVQFRDLGLVVVDEEQRFGVAQKERLKQIKKTVDVLTLTATPIPRTLQMGLANIRDMSIIETPPVDRLSIRTLLAPFDRRIIREAILRELERDGQVFFVHNRVQSIHRMGEFLRDLVPDARMGIAHGQMSENMLEEVMAKFLRREYNILLTTAIIESGLDIPTANTIVINRADRFGLADLYQLRGRVGRSGHQAYAYLLVPGDDALTEEAKKRLKAIQDLTELGSSFRLAMRDMEIRGAGNLLGRQQSGHIAAVGLDLYLEMMEKTVKTLRGERVEEEIDPTLNLQISAFIPESYVSDSGQRLSLYKRIAGLRDEAEIVSIEEEMDDRFGTPPEEVDTLLEVIRLKWLCRRAGVIKIERDQERLFLTLNPKKALGEAAVSRLLAVYSGHIRFLSEFTFQIRVSSRWPEAWVEIKNCLQEMVGYALMP